MLVAGERKVPRLRSASPLFARDDRFEVVEMSVALLANSRSFGAKNAPQETGAQWVCF